MVERYTLSDDKLTYTFVLRPGLKWHDGQPVTAADCVASLRRWASRDPMGQTLAKFTASLEAADASTIKLVLKEPYGLVLDSLAKIGAPVPFMMPERIARTPGSEQVKEIIGSGPYKFRADLHEPGVKIVLEKFADYRAAARAAGLGVGRQDRQDRPHRDAGHARRAGAGQRPDQGRGRLSRAGAGRHPRADRRQVGRQGRGGERLRLPGDHAHEPPAAAVRQREGAPGGGAADRPLALCRGGRGRPAIRDRLPGRSSAAACPTRAARACRPTTSPPPRRCSRRPTSTSPSRS